MTTENPAEAGPEALVVSIDEQAATRAVGEHVPGFGHRRVAVLSDYVLSDYVLSDYVCSLLSGGPVR